MKNLKEVLESVGLPAQRGIYTAKIKPKRYFTFQRLNTQAAAAADDKEKEEIELWRVTLISKGDFEIILENTKEALRAAGYYINSVDAEILETETGYWLIPITIQILKE